MHEVFVSLRGNHEASSVVDHARTNHRNSSLGNTKFHKHVALHPTRAFRQQCRFAWQRLLPTNHPINLMASLPARITSPLLILTTPIQAAKATRPNHKKNPVALRSVMTFSRVLRVSQENRVALPQAPCSTNPFSSQRAFCASSCLLEGVTAQGSVTATHYSGAFRSKERRHPTEAPF